MIWGSISQIPSSGRPAAAMYHQIRRSEGCRNPWIDLSHLSDRLFPDIRIGGTSSKSVAKSSLTGAAGRWSLKLSDGRSIYLELYQSGAKLFGHGSITLGGSSKGALASGSLSGNKMTVDLVPESGTELFSISLDISRLQLASKYTVYRYGTQPGYGTVLASRLP